MSLIFRDSQVLVISPGSTQTLLQCGLNEALLMPELYVPTRVYRSEAQFSHIEGEPVWPLERGLIKDQDAFHYFLQGVYATATTRAGIAPALLLVKSPQWSKRQLEQLCQFLFEECGVPALMLLSNPLSKCYALNARDCVVIDVGQDKTEISVVHEYESPLHLNHSLQVGGSSIDEFLAQEFGLSAEQAEDAKLSGTVEVPSGEQMEFSVESEEGVVDVAAIVASGKVHEILDKKADTEAQQNVTLEQNSFTDRQGASHTLGPARLKACDGLIDAIAKKLGPLVQRVPPRARAAVWANVVVTGRGALVPGFRLGLIKRLEDVYLVSNNALGAAATFTAPDSAARQTPNEGDAPAQAPQAIKLAQIADHFPEWKNLGWTQCGFLGAQIAAKQSFSGQSTFFVSRQDYNEIGPQAIWDL